MRDAESITQTVRDPSAAQPLKKEEGYLSDLLNLSKTISALDLQSGQAGLFEGFTPSNLRDIKPHAGEHAESSYFTHLSSYTPDVEVVDPEIRSALVESLRELDNQVLSESEIHPLCPANATPSGQDGQAIPLDSPVAPLADGREAAHEELAIVLTQAMPTPGGGTSTTSSMNFGYRTRDVTWNNCSDPSGPTQK